MPSIRITVAGRPAETTRWAAERHGRSDAEMRHLLSARRLAVDPVAMLDARTPLYDPDVVDAAIRDMPGRGKGGGRKPAASPPDDAAGHRRT